MLHGAAFLICRSEIKPPDACERDGRRTHRARLKGHIKVVAREAFASGGKTRLPDRDDFRVSRRIACGDDEIVPTPGYFAVRGDDNGSDRRLTKLRGALRLAKRFFHE